MSTTMGNKLQGKVAVVTGGNGGIGLATAKRFAAEGARVFITGRRQAELDAAVKEIGPQATGIQGDVARLADLDRLYEVVKQKADGVDIVFANAGTGEIAALGDITEKHFDDTFNTNVKGVLFTVQKALPLLRPGASIIINGSTTSIMATPAFSVYSATKAAVRNLARNWVLDLKGRPIRVNVLSPGPTRTPGLHTVAGGDASAQATYEQFAAAIPLGRLADPDEMAKVAVFLASDDSSFVNGIELFVDGGMAQV